MRSMEEDLNVNSYMVKEKLPADLKTLEDQVSALTKVAHLPAMGQQDLDQLNEKVVI